MPRNHYAEAILRGAKTVPTWWSMAGRENPYALKWINQPPSADGWYTQSPSLGPTVAGGLTFWFKINTTLTSGMGEMGLLGYTHSGNADFLSISIVYGGAGNPPNRLILAVKDAGGTVNTISSGSGMVLAQGWHNCTVQINGGTAFLFIDGVGLGAGVPCDPAFTTASALRIGAAESLQGTINTANHVTLDEFAFFGNGSVDPILAYNSGVPYAWPANTGGLIGHFVIEKATGAIHNRAIPLGTQGTQVGQQTAKDFLWYKTGLNTWVEVTKDALRKTDTNPFMQLSALWGDWSQGVTKGGQWAIGSGAKMTEQMPWAMPVPAGGGFDTLGYTGAFVGNKEDPHAVPVVTATGSFVQGTDSTAYKANGGTGSLTEVNNGRAQRILYPTFVKKI